MGFNGFPVFGDFIEIDQTTLGALDLVGENPKLKELWWVDQWIPRCIEVTIFPLGLTG